MKKKSILIILAVIMIVCCAIGAFQWAKSSNDLKTDSTVITSITATEENQKSNNELTSISTSKANGKVEGKVKANTTSQSKNSTKASATNATSSKSYAPTTKKAEAKKETKAITSTTTKSNKISVSLSITCKNIDHADILSSSSIALTQGDSVFDATKAICQSNGISLTYQSVYYIQGIGGIMEKDYGKTSGWMYRVNGTSPNTSAYNCKLKDGDTIEWYYVTSPSDK